MVDVKIPAQPIPQQFVPFEMTVRFDDLNEMASVIDRMKIDFFEVYPNPDMLTPDAELASRMTASAIQDALTAKARAMGFVNV